MNEERIDCFLKSDLIFLCQHFGSRVSELKKMSESKQIENMISVAKECFYLQRFIMDAESNGYPNAAAGIVNYLKDEFGSGNILIELQKSLLAEALRLLHGQCLLGENEYIVENSCLYYKSLNNHWYQIQPEEVFLLNPELSNEISSKSLITRLDQLHRQTSIEKIYSIWLSEPNQTKLSDKDLRIETGATSPEKYYEKSVEQIKTILSHNYFIEDLQHLHHEDEHYLERIVKVGFRLIEFVNTLRNEDSCNLYLLRDGIMFAEAQKTLDLIEGKKTDSAQILINRKLLSKNNNDEYYWALSVDALYKALRRYPNDFTQYYEEYSTTLAKIENEQADFKTILDELADYIRNNLNTTAHNVTIVDTGLQGSINMLTKYIIESRIYTHSEKTIDIRMLVVGDWFKDVYRNKFATGYYPIMTDIEIFKRSDELYHYKNGSFAQGNLLVELGAEYSQILANIELIVMTNLTRIMQQNKII